MARLRGCSSKASPTAAAGVGQDFSKVLGFPARELGDLLAATEAVGDDEGHGSGRLDDGEQASIGDGFGDFKLVCLKAEGASHATAA